MYTKTKTIGDKYNSQHVPRKQALVSAYVTPLLLGFNASTPRTMDGKDTKSTDSMSVAFDEEADIDNKRTPYRPHHNMIMLDKLSDKPVRKDTGNSRI